MGDNEQILQELNNLIGRFKEQELKCEKRAPAWIKHKSHKEKEEECKPIKRYSRDINLG